MKKTKTIQARVTDEFKEEIDNAVKKLGISISAFMIISMIEKLNRLQKERE